MKWIDETAYKKAKQSPPLRAVGIEIETAFIDLAEWGHRLCGRWGLKYKVLAFKSALYGVTAFAGGGD